MTGIPLSSLDFPGAMIDRAPWYSRRRKGETGVAAEEPALPQ